MTTIFVLAIDPDNWSSFYHSAERCPSFQEHEAQIVTMLAETLRTLAPAIVPGERSGLQSGAVHRQIINLFSQRMREEFGLVARLRPLMLQLRRPRVGVTAAMELRHLYEELAIQFERLKHIGGDSSLNDEEENRARTRRRITQIKSEIADLSKEQEESIASTELVQIEQDWQPGGC